MSDDYYKLIGVAAEASVTEIRQALTRQQRMWNGRQQSPDIDMRHDAEKMMRELAQARKILLNPDSRANYDRQAKANELQLRLPDPASPAPSPAPQQSRQPFPPPINPLPPLPRPQPSQGQHAPSKQELRTLKQFCKQANRRIWRFVRQFNGMRTADGARLRLDVACDGGVIIHAHEMHYHIGCHRRADQWWYWVRHVYGADRAWKEVPIDLASLDDLLAYSREFLTELTRKEAS